MPMWSNFSRGKNIWIPNGIESVRGQNDAIPDPQHWFKSGRNDSSQRFNETMSVQDRQMRWKVRYHLIDVKKVLEKYGTVPYPSSKKYRNEGTWSPAWAGPPAGRPRPACRGRVWPPAARRRAAGPSGCGGQWRAPSPAAAGSPWCGGSCRTRPPPCPASLCSHSSAVELTKKWKNNERFLRRKKMFLNKNYF